jgi:hypothetical protein
VLELDSHATEKEIKAAYRTLVKVWHPDRFQNDPILKMSAQQKLQNVNAAYNFLTSKPDTPSRRSRSTNANGPAQTEPGAAKANTTADWTPEPEGLLSLSRLNSIFGILLKVCLLVVAIVIGRYIWIAFDLPGLSSGDMHRVYDAGLDNVSKELPGPEHRFLETLEHDLKKMGMTGAAAAIATARQSEDAAAKTDETPQADATPDTKPLKKQSGKQSSNSAPTQNSAPAQRMIHSYITIGSTRDEVIAQQGPPTATSDDKLVYGRSELDLKNGAVVGWRIDPIANPIRVKLWPEHSVDTSQEYFTVDSTKDDVLVVQGTPTAFSRDKFEYGGSVVYFHNDRVISWKNDPTTIPLRIPIP